MLRGADGQPAIRFRPLEAVAAVEGLETDPPADHNPRHGSWDVGPWVRFSDLPDGTFVALELRHTYKRGWKVVRRGRKIIAPGLPAGEASRDRIVAWSFRAFLERALAAGGCLDLLEPDHEGGKP
jgi:hypothetical protein